MRNEKAFTLVEIMFVITLIAIVASIAVHNFRESRVNSQIKSLAFTLGTALSYAKDEAIMRRSHVTLCPSTDVNAESPECSDNGNWRDGYIVFLDQNGDGKREKEAEKGETLLRVFTSPGSAGSRTTIKDMPDSVTFLPTGFRNAIGTGIGVIKARIGSEIKSGDEIVVDQSNFYFELTIAENGTFKISRK